VSQKVHFVVNGIFSTAIAGGDIHFLKLAEAATRNGYEVNLFGGTALKKVAQEHHLSCEVTLTDDAAMRRVKGDALGGQLAMFRDVWGRYRRTLQLLDRIGPDEFVYATSDYWFDVLPVVRSRSRKKLMVLHMEAPRLAEIVTRRRADVDALRVASLHYWASQEWSLRRFCSCPPNRARKHLFHLHPLMKPRLQPLGLAADEMTLVSYGLDVAALDAVPAQRRLYDVVWIGRVHRQKGVYDLLQTLKFLAQRLPDLRVVFIGNLREVLLPKVKAIGLEKRVEFSGFVSDEEKNRLFKASRLFLMPSKHEGSPRVIGESIVAGTPVVAYDIPNYRPLFGNFVRYTPPFDLDAFKQLALLELQQMRSGVNYLDQLDLVRFKEENSWETLRAKFLSVLQQMK
jgi:glycosyltransferase involved in cell wall biosynthesis